MDELFTPSESDGEGDRARHAAMACFLSQGEGWRDAKGALGGTFADPAKKVSGLRAAKEE